MTFPPFVPPLNAAVRFYPFNVRRYVIGEVITMHGTDYVVVGRSIAGGQPYILIADHRPAHHGAAA